MKPQQPFRTIEVSDEDAPEVPAARTTKVSRYFIFSGRAFFRVTNPAGKSYTYKVHMRHERGERLVAFFVRVSTTGRGPFAYIGVLKDDGTILVTGRTHHLAGTPEFDVAQWAFRVILEGAALPEGYRIENIGKCGKCGLTLISTGEHDSGIHNRCL